MPSRTDFYDVDSVLAEEERAVRDSVRQFVNDQVLPIIGKCYVDGRFPKELVLPSNSVTTRGTTRRCSTCCAAEIWRCASLTARK